MNREEVLTGSAICLAANVADSGSSSLTFERMAFHGKHAGISKNRTCSLSIKTYSPVATISTKKLRFLLQVEQKSAVAVAQREEM